MKELLREMKKMSREIERNRKQATLKDFMDQKSSGEPEKIRIIIDNRELRSSIAKSLKDLDVDLQAETLEVGDYILSDRVGVETKTAEDLAQSIVDRRLFTQLGSLRDTFEIPLLLVSGSTLFAAGGVNPSAICGALASAMVDFHVPIINVTNSAEAANLLFAIARREQQERKQTFSLRGRKPLLSTSELQEYIVASLPGINQTLAKRLLTRFGNVNAVFQASSDQLTEVHGIGKNKAKVIRDAIDMIYKPES